MIGVRLDPVDTWFFRDSTPFAAGASPQEGVPSLFPPHPPTVAGALRAALARENGWNGVGSWRDAKIIDALGDGPDDLGKVSFDGPFLLRGGKPMFRAPRHLLGRLLGKTGGGKWNPTVFLRPGDPVECDLGEVRLPQTASRVEDPETLNPGDDIWLTAQGMTAALGARLPNAEDVENNAAFWESEYRIGLERDNRTRTAVEGLLYSARHSRLRRGVSLGVRALGMPDDWRAPFDRMMPLGGEGRLAECAEWDGRLGIESPIDDIRRSGRAVLVALTPLDIDLNIRDGDARLDELGGARVVSACLDRPQRIGGWDSKARRPLPLRSLLPPGSALFCELEAADALDTAPDANANDGLARVGRRKGWGFGLVALGVWPEPQEGN